MSSGKSGIFLRQNLPANIQRETRILRILLKMLVLCCLCKLERVKGIES